MWEAFKARGRLAGGSQELRMAKTGIRSCRCLVQALILPDGSGIFDQLESFDEKAIAFEFTLKPRVALSVKVPWEYESLQFTIEPVQRYEVVALVGFLVDKAINLK